MNSSSLKLIFTVVVMSLLVACSSTNYMVQQVDGVSENSKEKISIKNNTFYLVNGGDGKRGTVLLQEELAEGSGASAVNIANEYLAKHSQGIVSEKNILSKEKAIETGVSNKGDYLIFSQVERWTDPLGMNCSNHYYDEASVLLSIYSLSNNKLISTSRLSAKSCPHKVNGIPVTTGSPEKLFEILFDKWFNENFKL